MCHFIVVIWVLLVSKESKKEHILLKWHYCSFIYVVQARTVYNFYILFLVKINYICHLVKD